MALYASERTGGLWRASLVVCRRAGPGGPQRLLRGDYYEATATSSSVMRARLGSTFTAGPMVDDSVIDLM